MPTNKKQLIKTSLHPRNRNRERYDIKALITANPDLVNHIIPNKFGEDSVDFSNPLAVKSLNKALLKYYYHIDFWEFPEKNLCPPIPGRADYIHHIADLLAENNSGIIPTGENIICLDIGTGASCIYPIIGVAEYDWSFIGSDIDPQSVESATNIIESNSKLKSKIECKLQNNKHAIFYGIIGKEERIDLSISNPPFHSSMEEALEGTQRKIKNLYGKKSTKPLRNFSGVNHELIYEGGEYMFIYNMIMESKIFAKNCFLFSTLVSKQSNLKGIYKLLEEAGAKLVKTIPMGTGNKSTRIVAWTFLSKEEQKEWVRSRWKVL